jgi:hypothetical protein
MANSCSISLKTMLQSLRLTSRNRLRATAPILPIVLLCCAALLLASWDYGNLEAANSRAFVPISAPTPPAPKSSIVPAMPAGDRVEGEVVTIRSSGFDPKQISRPAERFTLLVDNRSGLAVVNLRLDRVGGSRLHEVLVPREKLDWVKGLDLTPGDYLLTEASRPDWICRITIRAN